MEGFQTPFLKMASVMKQIRWVLAETAGVHSVAPHGHASMYGHLDNSAHCELPGGVMENIERSYNKLLPQYVQRPRLCRLQRSSVQSRSTVHRASVQRTVDAGRRASRCVGRRITVVPACGSWCHYRFLFFLGPRGCTFSGENSKAVGEETRGAQKELLVTLPALFKHIPGWR